MPDMRNTTKVCLGFWDPQVLKSFTLHIGGGYSFMAKVLKVLSGSVCPECQAADTPSHCTRVTLCWWWESEWMQIPKNYLTVIWLELISLLKGESSRFTIYLLYLNVTVFFLFSWEPHLGSNSASNIYHNTVLLCSQKYNFSEPMNFHVYNVEMVHHAGLLQEQTQWAQHNVWHMLSS
jgi:hypothetical protein